MPANKKVHFVGIGGIGMSALARWFRAQGYEVTGSDLSPSSTTRELSAEGISVKIGRHLGKNVPKDAGRVIYNNAIRDNNPELLAAKRMKIPAASYPQSLGELTKLYKTIAISGAHGKSTTTAMVSLILKKARFDPTVIIGTKLAEFGGKNFVEGKSEYLVIEADEWKAAFLNYFPYAALVTNIDREHLDFYKNLSNVKKTFVQFLQNIHPYGLAVLNHDDKNVYAIRKRIKRPIVWYSFNSKEAEAVKKVLKIPGIHNLSNAVGAYTIARAIGVKRPTILKALGAYNGAWRRSEFRGHYKSAEVYDDYGHHPTEIRATLAGFREKYPDRKIICVFQPHQRERLKLLFRDFTKAFDSADETILFEIYSVAGRERKDNSITSDKLASSMERRNKKPVPVVADVNGLRTELNKLLDKDRGSVILMMGAGNIVDFTDKLISN